MHGCFVIQLKKMSKIVNSIAEDRRQLTLELSSSPVKDEMESPRYRSPIKEVLEVVHSPVKNSFPSPEEAVKTPVGGRSYLRPNT